MSDETNNPKPDTPKSWKQMLLAIPTPNTAANAKYDEESGLVTVTVKNIKPDYMIPPFSWVVHFSPKKDITLDKLGSQLWKLCNGRNTVENIIDKFKDAHELTFHEARTSVVEYLKKLIQRGVVAVIIQEEK